MIDAWLSKNGRTPGSLNAVERLCYTGTRGMGALEFFPEIGIDPTADEALKVDELSKLASDILNQREGLRTSIHSSSFEHLISVGTSAGGARAKAVIAINKKTGEVRSGQIDAGKDYEHWLIKFDRIKNNRDKEDVDDHQHTVTEYAYYQMAILAGIDMSECKILSQSGEHFLTKRFDRTADGGKLHMLSLAGMAHYDYNIAGEHSYEEIADIIRRIGCDYHDIRQLYRRMVFNHKAKNYDDHVKNISFLMQRDGTWSLAPAYDITFSYNPAGAWTSRHQMTVNGKMAGIDDNDLIASGKNIGISASDMRNDIERIENAIEKWTDIATSVGLREERAAQIKDCFEK